MSLQLTYNTVQVARMKLLMISLFLYTFLDKMVIITINWLKIFSLVTNQKFNI